MSHLHPLISENSDTCKTNVVSSEVWFGFDDKISTPVAWKVAKANNSSPQKKGKAPKIWTGNILFPIPNTQNHYYYFNWRGIFALHNRDRALLPLKNKDIDITSIR